jgi:hypothetical protein
MDGGMGTAAAEVEVWVWVLLGAAVAEPGTSATAPLRTTAIEAPLANIFRLFTLLLSALASRDTKCTNSFRLLWILC